jgi:hypothetical protein
MSGAPLGKEVQIEAVMQQSYFVLNALGEPQVEPDVDAWLRWFEQADRNIARTSVTSHVVVLTTFRGVDEPESPGDAPRLFETRVFGGVLNGEEVHHATKDEALAAHTRLVDWCRAGATPGFGFDEQALR